MGIPRNKNQVELDIDLSVDSTTNETESKTDITQDPVNENDGIEDQVDNLEEINTYNQDDQIVEEDLIPDSQTDERKHSARHGTSRGSCKAVAVAVTAHFARSYRAPP